MIPGSFPAEKLIPIGAKCKLALLNKPRITRKFKPNEVLLKCIDKLTNS